MITIKINQLIKFLMINNSLTMIKNILIISNFNNNYKAISRHHKSLVSGILKLKIYFN